MPDKQKAGSAPPPHLPGPQKSADDPPIEDELLDAQDEYGVDAFTAGVGAEAVKQMLIDLDLDQEKEDLL